MAAEKKAKQRAGQTGQQDPVCPFCQIQKCFLDMVEKDSAFCEHMTRAREEFLKGIRAWIDARIGSSEKARRGRKTKITKIRVED